MKKVFRTIAFSSIFILLCSNVWSLNLSSTSDAVPEDQQETIKIVEPDAPADRGITQFASNSVVTQAVPAGTPEAHTKGVFGPPFGFPIVPIHMTLLPDGRVLSFGTDDIGTQTAHLLHAIWDPLLGYGSEAHFLMDNTVTTDIFCAGQAVIPSTGETFIAGGDAVVNGVKNYSNADTTFYNHQSGILSNGPQMAKKRWYATLTTLANGEILIAGGRTDRELLDSAPFPEIYSPVTGLRTLSAATNEEAYGNLYDSWHYPPSFQAPNGKVFVMPQGTGKMYYLDTSGNGSLQQTGTIQKSHYSLPNVMYAPGKILSLRGGSNPRVYTVDLNGATPSYTLNSLVSQWRFWSNLTVLADGKVLLDGGSTKKNVAENVAYHTEIWDPDTGQWTLGASAQKMRLYHSASLLLPDATVLTGGGGAPGPQLNLNGEIYYPPYLYDASGLPAVRPSITSAPNQATWNHQYTIKVDTPEISRVTLVRTGSATHSLNTDQRFIPLQFTQTQADELTITTPLNPNIAPPGYYMLFVLNQAGVPSIAEIVHLNDLVTPAATIFAAPMNISAGQSATINWTSTNAVNCVASGGWSGDKALSGTLVVTPSATTTYTLACSGPSGAVTRYTTVNVGGTGGTLPPTVNLSASPASITAGQTSTITWTSNNADNCTASGAWSGTKATSGSESVSPTASATYNLACTGAGGTTSKSTTVTVEGTPPPVGSLAAHWKLDETSGTDASDSSEYGNIGTLVNGPVWDTGTIDGALLFDGTDDYVSFENSASLNIASNKITLEAWVKPDSVSGPPQTIVAKPVSATSHTKPFFLWGLTILKGGKIQFLVASSPTSPKRAYSDTSLTANTWNHVAGVYNGTNMIVYVNGIASTTPVANTANLQSRDTPVRIGVTGGFTEPMNGLIDDVRVYSRALTQAEIASDMNGGGTTNPSPTVSLLANPASIVSGDSSTLSWSSSNADTCTASGAWTGSKALSGTEVVTPATTGTYTLACTGPGGTASQSTTITVSALPAPSVDLSANPASIVSGDSSTLSWSSTNADTCTASGAWTGSKALSGTEVVTPTETGTYTLTCTGSGETASQSTTITVSALPAPTVTLSANPASITSGDSSTLSWSSTNADTCTASGAWTGSKALSGTEVVTPTETGTYTLICTDPGGSSATQSATVTVSSTPATSTLAAHWKLDESSDTTASDSSEFGNTGTLVNGPIWGTGQIGGAISFDGINDYVNVDHSASLNNTSNTVTLEAWVYTNTIGVAPQMIVSKPVSATTHTNPYFSYGISVNKPGKIQFAIANSATSLVRAFSTSTLTANTWHHVAGVYDGTNMVVYVNGIAGTPVANTANLRSYNTPVRIGVNGGFGEPMNGKIDDVRIYSRALTQAEIVNDMNGGAPQ